MFFKKDVLLNRLENRTILVHQNKRQKRITKIQGLMSHKEKMLNSNFYKRSGKDARRKMDAEYKSLPLDLWIK